MRISYWTETVREAGRETFDAARRRWQHALAIFVALLITAVGIRFTAVTGYLRNDLMVAAALFVAVAVLFGSLFVWKLISIPPRRHAAQAREISRLSSELQHVRSDSSAPSR